MRVTSIAPIHGGQALPVDDGRETTIRALGWIDSATAADRSVRHRRLGWRPWWQTTARSDQESVRRQGRAETSASVTAVPRQFPSRQFPCSVPRAQRPVPEIFQDRPAAIIGAEKTRQVEVLVTPDQMDFGFGVRLWRDQDQVIRLQTPFEILPATAQDKGSQGQPITPSQGLRRAAAFSGITRHGCAALDAALTGTSWKD
jgi:hypothetical protein